MAKEDKDAEAEIEDDGAEGEEGQEEEGKRKFSGKFLVMFVALPLLVLIGGGGGAAYFFGAFDSAPMALEGDKMVVVEPEKPKFYYDLPEMLVNLNSQKRNSQFLKLQVALEIADENVTETLEPQLPRILDTFQIYLRELRSGMKQRRGMLRGLKRMLIRN